MDLIFELNGTDPKTKETEIEIHRCTRPECRGKADQRKKEFSSLVWTEKPCTFDTECFYCGTVNFSERRWESKLI